MGYCFVLWLYLAITWNAYLQEAEESNLPLAIVSDLTEDEELASESKKSVITIVPNRYQGLANLSSQLLVKDTHGSRLTRAAAAVSCLLPDWLQANNTKTSYKLGDKITDFQCKAPGHAVKGPNMIICQKNGQWTTNSSPCKKVTCPLPDWLTVTNPKEEYNLGQSITDFECKTAGYAVKGPGKIICQTNGKWTSPDLCSGEANGNINGIEMTNTVPNEVNNGANTMASNSTEAKEENEETNY